MSIYAHTGKMALGSRLRLLGAKMTDDATKIYDLYQVGLAPKWFPVFYVLSEQGEAPITEIAVLIGHSQPSVSKIVREMTEAGLVQENRASNDKRKNVVALTRKGKRLIEKIRIQYTDVEAAVEQLITESTHNLWEAIAEWEFLLEQKSLLQRVTDAKKQRESHAVQIVEFADEHQAAFRALNVAWISEYFEMEEADYEALDHPKEYILNNGGAIVMAIYEGIPVGTCALIKSDNPVYPYEMAKMAVSPQARGKNIGWQLGQAIIQQTKARGAKTLYLESNTILKPAINLYLKLGFKKVVGIPTPYKRANIQMALDLTETD